MGCNNSTSVTGDDNVEGNHPTLQDNDTQCNADTDDKHDNKNLAKKLFHDIIKKDALDLPCTFAVCGPPGCGKSKFIQAIANECKLQSDNDQPLHELKQNEMTCCCCKIPWCWKLLLWFFLALAFTGLSIGPTYLGLYLRNESNDLDILLGSGIGSLFIFSIVFFLTQINCCSDEKSNGTHSCKPCCSLTGLCRRRFCCKCSSCCQDCGSLCYMSFFQPNRFHDENVHKNNVRVINVDFNAWQYTGCDYLWAGVAISIGNALEDYFGKWKVRLCRLFLSTTDDKGNRDTEGNAHKCYCCCFRLNFHMIASLTVYVVATAVALILIFITNDESAQNNSWIAALILLVPIIGWDISAVVKFISAGVRSTESEINKICRKWVREEGQLELGFAHKIQEEMEHLARTVAHMNDMYGQNFRVLVVVEGLETCKSDRLLGFLEAIKHLFEIYKRAPFYIFLSLDTTFVYSALRKRKEEEVYGVPANEFLNRVIDIPIHFPIHDEEMRELNTRNRAAGCTIGGYVVCWERLQGNEGWQPYSTEHQMQLSSAFDSGQPCVVLEANDGRREVSFERGIAKSTSNDVEENQQTLHIRAALRKISDNSII